MFIIILSPRFDLLPGISQGHANYVFKGIVAPAARHRVMFRFSPPWFREGLAVTATTILLILGLWVFGAIRRNQFWA